MKTVANGSPCVILATPGMLQSGTSRELFELWAPDIRNGVVITGYSTEGTLAKVSLVHITFLILPSVLVLVVNIYFFPTKAVTYAKENSETFIHAL